MVAIFKSVGKVWDSMRCEIVLSISDTDGKMRSNKYFPSSVNSTFRAVRCNNLTPNCSSSRWICWLIPGCETNKFLAAFVKLTVLPPSIQYLNEEKFIKPPPYLFDYSKILYRG